MGNSSSSSSHRSKQKQRDAKHKILNKHQNDEQQKMLKKIFNQLGTKLNLQQDQLLLTQDVPSKNIYYINSGSLTLVVNNNQNKVKLAQRGVGDVVGELGMLLGHKVSADAIAETKLEVLQVQHDDLIKQLRDDPMSAGQLFKYIATSLSERISELSGKMRSNVTQGQAPKGTMTSSGDMTHARKLFRMDESAVCRGVYACSVRREVNAVKEANAHFGELYIYDNHLCFDLKMFAFHRQMIIEVADIVAYLRSETDDNTAEIQSKGQSVELYISEGFEEALLIMEACRVKTKAMMLHKTRSNFSDKQSSREEISVKSLSLNSEKLPSPKELSIDDFHHVIEPIVGGMNGELGGNSTPRHMADLELKESDWKSFLGIAVQRIYKKGEYLVHEGEKSSTLYQVIRGSLRVEMLLNEEAQAVVVGYRGPGEMLGETSLLKEGVATASVTAHEDTTVLCLQGASLERLFADTPLLPSRFFYFLAMYQADRLYKLTQSFAAEKPHVTVAANLALSMTEIVGNPAHCGVLRKFLDKASTDVGKDEQERDRYLGMVTLLDFYVVAQGYTQLPDWESLKEGASTLYLKYLNPRSSTSLLAFINEETINAIEAVCKNLESPTLSRYEARQLFQPAQREVFEHISKGCYEEFLGSSHYRYILELKAKENIVPALDDFKVVRVLGEGGFGQVIDVVKRDCGAHYAMKVMSKDSMRQNLGSSWRKKIASEQSIMASLHHPFLVNLKYAFQNMEYLILVMDLVPSGDLSEFVLTKKRLTAAQVKWVVMQVVEVLGYMHTQMILYRDLKPENILVDNEGNIRLIDMGLAARVTEKSPTRTSRVGTDCYMAPEVRWARKRRAPYTFSADWYTVGVLHYEFSHGAIPFSARDTDTPIYRGGTWPSAEAQSFAEELLEQDHRRRLGSGKGGTQDVKNHAFFSGVDWDVVAAGTMKSPMKGVKGIPKRKKDKEVQAQRTAGNIAEADRAELDASANSSETKIDSWDFVSATAITDEYMDSVYACVSSI